MGPLELVPIYICAFNFILLYVATKVTVLPGQLKCTSFIWDFELNLFTFSGTGNALTNPSYEC